MWDKDLGVYNNRQTNNQSTQYWIQVNKTKQHTHTHTHCAPRSDVKKCLAAEFVGSRHYTVAFSLQVPKSRTELDPTLLYISI